MWYPLLRPLLFTLDAERAHHLTLGALQAAHALGLTRLLSPRPPVCAPRKVMGLEFPNPVGLAAGLDKNGAYIDALAALGFGHLEIGTVTPRAQAGIPKPRIFRLVEDEGDINRLGFNNEGHAAALERLKQARLRGIVGVIIGANKDSEDRIADYVQGIETFYSVASYFTVNISSPNTPGLRDLQARESLAALLAAVLERRSAEAERLGKRVPVFLKIAPDLTEEGLDDVAEEALAHDLDGLIVSNTTLSRDGLRASPHKGEAGGLSGKPLFELSTTVLAKMRRRVGAALPIIGVGGVSSAETALEKVRAGADLAQLYSCMVYEGPGLPSTIVKGLSDLVSRDGVASIRDLRDSAVDRWADRKLG